MKRVFGVVAIVVLVGALGIAVFRTPLPLLIAAISMLPVVIYKSLGLNASGPVKRIFSAIGIFAGVAVILWGAMVAMKFFGRGDFEKAQSSVSTLDYLVRGLVTYSEEHGRFPPAKSMEELQKILVPKYMGDLNLRDGWGRPWHLEMNPQEYRIWSLGADNRPDAFGPARKDADIDIILHNGSFVSVPPGTVVAFGGR